MDFQGQEHWTSHEDTLGRPTSAAGSLCDPGQLPFLLGATPPPSGSLSGVLMEVAGLRLPDTSSGQC